MRAGIVSILAFYALLGRCALPAVGQEAQSDVPDAFKLFETFPFAVAAFDADQDGDLDCLTAIREEYAPQRHYVKYIWVFPGVNGHKKENYTLIMREGPSPDKAQLTLDDGGPQRIAKFDYTDYKTCTVVEIPFKNIETCVLWVTFDAVADIPQDCVSHYEKSCDVKRATFDPETCKGVLPNP